MSGALLLLVMNFIGLGLGPTYVGVASDHFRAAHPAHSLQITLLHAHRVLLSGQPDLPVAGAHAASRKLATEGQAS
jgi:hypothetical protein